MVDMGQLVMLVEDDDDLRDLEAMLLERAGYRVVTAREGEEALDRVAQEMPAMIFLDMRMPGMDGWTFAREFRARHDHGAPLVVVTAESNARTRAEEIRADGFLGKPFAAHELMMTVQVHLRATRPRSSPE
jgi:chemosensory pili system protein ChpA (sensor histidine kinase/response regulator)